MDIEVYCDESRPDLLSSKNPLARYMLIGGIWIERENREKFKAEIHQLRDKYKIGGEFKWQKVSPSRELFYIALADWFFSKGLSLRFRCIAVEHSQVDLRTYHGDDQELGFYKFYYQLLHHWIHENNHYSVFVDYKVNRDQDRLHVLYRCLESSHIFAHIAKVQAVRSEESVFIQLVDFLTGLAAYRLNNQINEQSAKARVLTHYEVLLGHNLMPTTVSEKKINIFKIDLSGGW